MTLPPAKAPVSDETLAGNRASARARGLPWLSPFPAREAPLAVVGGGQSAADHLDEILTWPGDVLAINGAYDWLRPGRVPDWHFILDPLPACVGFVQHPSSLTRYVVADSVAPALLDALDGQNVTLCDLSTAPGGSTAMTRAPMVGALLGYRRIDLFGADSSFGERRHVYDQPAPEHWAAIECDGRVYRSRLDLLRQAAEIVEALPVWRAGLDVRVRGDDHLAAAMIRTGGVWRDALSEQAEGLSEQSEDRYSDSGEAA